MSVDVVVGWNHASVRRPLELLICLVVVGWIVAVWLWISCSLARWIWGRVAVWRDVLLWLVAA